MRNIGIAFAIAFALLIARGANAQVPGNAGYYGGQQPGTGQPAATAPQGGGGYDSSGDVFYDPMGAPQGGAVAPPPQVAPPPPPPAGPQTWGSSEAAQPPAAEDEGFKGFELGINWAGGAKVALEPGFMFGKVGIYLLAGIDLAKVQEKATTDDWQLGTWSDPTAGGTHFAGEHDYDESVTMSSMMFTYDIGIATRFYLLEALKAQSPNLFLEIGLGWRGAAVKNTIDWNFTGDEDALGDVNGDGDVDAQDAKDLEYDRNKTWNLIAEDYAHDAEQQADGLWLNLGLGGEYVFPGGFGVAGEAGLSLFWNTPYTVKGPYGYDDDASGLGDIDWEYQDIKHRGWAVDFGFYYNLALRYHF
jgi:hypothetical protein